MAKLIWIILGVLKLLFLKALRNTEIMLEPGGKFFIEPTFMSVLFEGIDFKYRTQGFCRLVDQREIGCVITALEKEIDIANKNLKESEVYNTEEESKDGNEDRNSRTSLFDIILSKVTLGNA